MTDKKSNGCFTVIDLFCGAGGLSYGFSEEEYKVMLGIDNDSAALKTFQKNHHDSKIINKDVTKVSKSKIAKIIGKKKVDVIKTKELKEQVKIKKRTDMLIPLEDYVRAGIYLGTKVVTPDMRPFVYRRRADGLAIFNTEIIDEKLKEGIKYLSKFNPENIILACKRQAGWKAAKMFSQLTGIRVFTKKYPAGNLTKIGRASCRERV